MTNAIDSNTKKRANTNQASAAVHPHLMKPSAKAAAAQQPNMPDLMQQFMSTNALANPSLVQTNLQNTSFSNAGKKKAAKSALAMQQQAMMTLLSQPNGMATFLIGFQSQMD